MRRFEGKAVLVTGAASGIGKATALRLAEEGAHVACLDLADDAVQLVVKEIAANGGTAWGRTCDVADEAAVIDAVGASASHLGGLDVVVNVAGILRTAHSHETSLAMWEQVVGVNLTGTFLVCREAIPHLLERGRDGGTVGNIVNVASTAALGGHPWMVAYAASKGGVVALTKTLAVEYGKQGLRVNAVCPGAIDTPIQNSFELPEGADGKLLRRTMPVLKMFGAPDTVAGTIAYLAGPDGSHTSGAILTVDGAMQA
jgi:NAD(P)-dependent dehydrogenase (short-subunit alcohol dehydrogenase family)